MGCKKYIAIASDMTAEFQAKKRIGIRGADLATSWNSLASCTLPFFSDTKVLDASLCSCQGSPLDGDGMVKAVESLIEKSVAIPV